MYVKNPRVMVIDDEIAALAMMKKVVQSLGYEVVSEAGDGLEALEKFENSKPDLILLDIMMPVMSGEEVLMRIKETNPETCIIIISVISDEETMEICMKYGASSYITKSTPVSEMQRIIGDTWNTFNRIKQVLNIN